jgi:hypothetical protein
MTTAFAWTVRGRWIAALQAQPAGFLLAAATMLAAALSLHELTTGRAWRINWYRVTPSRAVLAAAGVLLASWIYKILVTYPNVR